jgi:release factor glutamine methyltransferase
MTTPDADAAVRRRNNDGASVATVAGVRRALAKKFGDAGIESPELDARLIVGHALSLDHAALIACSARILNAVEQAEIATLAQRRLAHEPVARIIGHKEFWSLPFRVEAATFVPRPETEMVVETALAAIDASAGRSQKLRIADLGTGSGVLLLALLAELPAALGVGTDVSASALRVARDNAQGMGLSRANFVVCDMASALGGPFDLIVSNPPYIASGDIAALAPDVRDFDPLLALDGGVDGLACYRAIAASAPALLRPGGALVVEIGAGQAPAVGAMFAAAGLAPSPPRADLNGIARALIATKCGDR